MIQLVTPPESWPVSLAEAKSHLRLTGTEEESLLSFFIGGSTEVAEKITGRQLEPATYDLFLDRFPGGPIEVPRPPLQSVVSVTYTDSNGEEQSLPDFQTDTVGGRVLPAYGSTWPTTRDVPNAVRIRFVAGYSAGLVPHSIRCAILLLVGGLYENRESDTPGKFYESEAVGRLLWPWRVF